MNKLEFRKMLDDILNLIEDGKYAAAVSRCDELNLDLITQPGALKEIAKAYEKCRRYEDAEDLLLQARNAAPKSRGILFHLCVVAIKAKDIEDAELYYDDFCRLAPKDPERYVIQYRLSVAKGRPVEELIEILEHLRAGEPDDQWLYVLADLYAGRKNNEKALEVIDEIELWFDGGRYVEMARALKDRILNPTDETLLTEQDFTEQKESVKIPEAENAGQAEEAGTAVTDEDQEAAAYEEAVPETAEHEPVTETMPVFEFPGDEVLTEESDAALTTETGDTVIEEAGTSEAEIMEDDAEAESESETVADIPEDAGNLEELPEDAEVIIETAEIEIEAVEAEAGENGEAEENEEKPAEIEKPKAENISEADDVFDLPDFDELEADLFGRKPVPKHYEPVREAAEDAAETPAVKEAEAREKAAYAAEIEEAAREEAAAAAEEEKKAAEEIPAGAEPETEVRDEEPEESDQLSDETQTFDPVRSDTVSSAAEEPVTERPAAEKADEEDFVSAYSVSQGGRFFDPEKNDVPAEEQASDETEEGTWWAAAVRAADEAEKEKQEEIVRLAVTRPEDHSGDREIFADTDEEHVVISVPVPDIIRTGEKLDKELTFTYDETVDRQEVTDEEFVSGMEEILSETDEAEAEENTEEADISEDTAEEEENGEEPEETTVKKKKESLSSRKAKAVEQAIYSEISEIMTDNEETAEEEKETEEDAPYAGLPVNPQITRHTWHFMIASESLEAAEKSAVICMDKISALNLQSDLSKAKVSAVRIGSADIVDSLDKFLGNMTLIEKASLLSDTQLQDFAKVLDKDDRSLLIIFEDTAENIAAMLKRVPSLKQSFTAVMEVSDHDPEQLLRDAEEMMADNDAVLTEDAKQKVLERAKALVEADEPEPGDKILAYVQAALKKAEKGGFLGMGAGKVDRAGILQVNAKHFKGL